MSLTKEERAELELQCANAKYRCREAWQVLQALERITRTYFKIHDEWRKRFEKADRVLAMEERLTVIKDDIKKEKKLKLTRKDLEDILKELEEED